MLLANPGSVVAKWSLVAAVNAIEELEQTAKVLILLRGSRVSVLSDEQVAELERRFAS